MTVTISGIVNGICGTCGDLNTTFMLHHTSDNSCTWNCCFYNICGVNCIACTVYQDGSDYKIKVDLLQDEDVLHQWIKNYSTTKPICSEISGDTLTHQTSSGMCNSSSATCVIGTDSADNCVCLDNWPDKCGCCSESLSSTMVLAISGFTGDCSCLNGIYYLYLSTVSGTVCGWGYAETGCGELCSSDLQVVGATMICAGGTSSIVVNFWDPDAAEPTPGVQFYKEVAGTLCDFPYELPLNDNNCSCSGSPSCTVSL
jgi:hypothetical protein